MKSCNKGTEYDYYDIGIVYDKQNNMEIIRYNAAIALTSITQYTINLNKFFFFHYIHVNKLQIMLLIFNITFEF